MKVICIRGGCEWLNGYMCRVTCEHMRVTRTPSEIEADKRREAARLKKARARREIEAFRRRTSDEKRVFEAVSGFEPGN